MEELKNGEYVRLNNGKIFVLTIPNLSTVQFTIDGMIKHSPNIIDLIEVGDYVNGYPVIDIGQDYICVCDFGKSEDLIEEDIKTIVTKEQFESMKYKVGD
jgi:hypothetical protein